jgi:hypothetical protein
VTYLKKKLAEVQAAEEEKDNKRAKLVAKLEIKRATSAERNRSPGSPSGSDRKAQLLA